MAKNISSFSPGMASGSEMLDYCEYILRSSGGPGDDRSNDYGLGCASWCYQTDHNYAGSVLVRMISSGGGTGGVCCCMNGVPGASAPYAFFSVNPKTGCHLCWKINSGGCCVPSNTGSPGECYHWVKDDQQDATGRIFLPPGQCSCSVCNGPACNRCYCVCYQDNQVDEYTCTGGKHSSNSFPRYVCKNCFVADGGSNHWLDSDTHINPSRVGFISTGKCCNGGGGAVCKVVMFGNMPAYAAGKREYYMSMSYGGENCYGGWLTACQACFWWGASTRQGGDAKCSSMCAAGSPGIGASANGGNCYCGGNGMAGLAVSLYYRLGSEPTG